VRVVALLLLLLLQVDRDTLDMLKAINMASLPGVTMQQVGPAARLHIFSAAK
jgi:hypothetical protein